MTNVFWALYFNSGIVLLLASANFEHSYFAKYVPWSGQYTDLTQGWYLDMAPTIMMTYIIIAFMPYFDMILNYLTAYIMRSIDTGSPCFCLNPKNPTKKKTIQHYVDLYSGPELFLYNKYASMLNLVFVVSSLSVNCTMSCCNISIASACSSIVSVISSIRSWVSRATFSVAHSRILAAVLQAWVIT